MLTRTLGTAWLVAETALNEKLFDVKTLPQLVRTRQIGRDAAKAVAAAVVLRKAARISSMLEDVSLWSLLVPTARDAGPGERPVPFLSGSAH